MSFLKRFGCKIYEFENQTDLVNAKSVWNRTAHKVDAITEFEAGLEKAGIDYLIELDDFIEEAMWDTAYPDNE
jgi:hypothetical protein